MKDASMKAGRLLGEAVSKGHLSPELANAAQEVGPEATYQIVKLVNDTPPDEMEAVLAALDEDGVPQRERNADKFIAAFKAKHRELFGDKDSSFDEHPPNN